MRLLWPGVFQSEMQPVQRLSVFVSIMSDSANMSLYALLIGENLSQKDSHLRRQKSQPKKERKPSVYSHLSLEKNRDWEKEREHLEKRESRREQKITQYSVSFRMLDSFQSDVLRSPQSSADHRRTWKLQPDLRRGWSICAFRSD